MPLLIDLAIIPAANIIAIAKKLTPKELANFQRTNIFIHDVCHFSKNLVTLKVDVVRFEEDDVVLHPYRIRYSEKSEALNLFKIKCDNFDCVSVLTTAVYYKLFGIIDKLKLKMETFNFTLGATCSAQELKNLLRHTEASSVLGDITRERYPPQIFASISNKFVMDRLAYNDEDLLQLKANVINFSMADITASGVNRLIKEWERGQRDLKQMFITVRNSINVEEAIAGTTANVLYTPSWHELSHNSDGNRMRRQFYIFWKSEDISTKYCLIFSERGVLFKKEDNPSKLLRSASYWCA